MEALDNLLTKKSFVELSVSEIATEAGLTTGAIYRRFENKEALLAAAIARGMIRTQGTGKTNRELFTSSLPDSQLIMNLMKELFQLTFNNIHIMRAANYVVSPKELKGLIDVRNASADWFSRLLEPSKKSDDDLKHRCRFIFKMAMAVYFDTLLSGIPPEADRDAYLKTNKRSIDRLISNLHEMCCKYLDILPTNHSSQ